MADIASTRAKRQIAPNAKQNALAKLADLKRNGGKRTEQYQVPALPFAESLCYSMTADARRVPPPSIDTLTIPWLLLLLLGRSLKRVTSTMISMRRPTRTS